MPSTNKTQCSHNDNANHSIYYHYDDKKTAILREKIPYSEKVNGNLNSIDTTIRNARNKPIPIQNKTTLQTLYFLLSDLSASV